MKFTFKLQTKCGTNYFLIMLFFMLVAQEISGYEEKKSIRQSFRLLDPFQDTSIFLENSSAIIKKTIDAENLNAAVFRNFKEYQEACIEHSNELVSSGNIEQAYAFNNQIIGGLKTQLPTTTDSWILAKNAGYGVSLGAMIMSADLVHKGASVYMVPWVFIFPDLKLSAFERKTSHVLKTAVKTSLGFFVIKSAYDLNRYKKNVTTINNSIAIFQSLNAKIERLHNQQQ